MEKKKIKASTSTTKKTEVKKEAAKKEKEVKETKTTKKVASKTTKAASDVKEEKRAKETSKKETKTSEQKEKTVETSTVRKDRGEKRGFATARFNRGFPNKFGKRKRFCKLCAKGVNHVDYKDVDLLYKYLTNNLKITSAKITSSCRKHQTMIAAAIKRARLVALIPYIKD